MQGVAAPDGQAFVVVKTIFKSFHHDSIQFFLGAHKLSEALLEVSNSKPWMNVSNFRLSHCQLKLRRLK